MADVAKLRERYGESAQGNFYVVDTIGVPHTYVIGPRHVAFASDHRGGILSDEAIKAAERHGAHCQQRGCTLNYGDHKQALLVNCKVAIKGDDGKVNPELHEWLLKVKPLCEEDHYAGFAFMDDRANKGDYRGGN